MVVGYKKKEGNVSCIMQFGNVTYYRLPHYKSLRNIHPELTPPFKVFYFNQHETFTK